MVDLLQFPTSNAVRQCSVKAEMFSCSSEFFFVTVVLEFELFFISI